MRRPGPLQQYALANPTRSHLYFIQIALPFSIFMKQIKLVSLAIFLFASAAAAQNKLLTIDDIFSLDSKVRVNFSGSPSRLVWSSDAKSFRQMKNGGVSRVNAVTGDAAPYFDSTKFK